MADGATSIKGRGRVHQREKGGTISDLSNTAYPRHAGAGQLIGPHCLSLFLATAYTSQGYASNDSVRFLRVAYQVNRTGRASGY